MARPSNELLVQDLGEALTRGELGTEYQPIVRTADGQVTGVEALLRWPDPNRGRVEPETIVSLAERSGLIGEIGRWVLDRACRDLQRWQDPRRPGQLKIAVNVSPQQLMSVEFAETVAMVLTETGTDPGVVTLEVTETVLMEDGDRAMLVMRDLRDLGVSIALDGFGTGYSSLSYLRRLPVDIVKIDRGFVVGLGDPTTSAIVSTVVGLAHILGMTVVAEGVETAAQYDEVAAFGCEESRDTSSPGRCRQTLSPPSWSGNPGKARCSSRFPTPCDRSSPRRHAGDLAGTACS